MKVIKSNYIKFISGELINGQINQLSVGSGMSPYPSAAAPTWIGQSAYSIGAKVTDSFDRNEYVSLANITAVTVPASNLAPNSSPTQWKNQGISAAYKLIDFSTGTYSSFAGAGGVFLITGAQGDGLALMNMVNVATVVVSAINTGTATSVYSATFTLNGKTDLFISNLPNIALTPINITVTVTGIGGTTAYIGSCVWGVVTDIGGTQYGTSTGITDYSYRSTDAFGNLTVTLRTYAKRISSNLMIKNSNLDSVFNFLAANRSLPIVWVGSDSTYTSLITFGVWKDFDINIAYPDYSTCSLTIDGLA